MARCLVTGHKGYIGSRLYAELKKQGHDVVGVDMKDSPDDDILLPGCLEDLSSFSPEYIFHLACIPRVAYSVENPVSTMQNNVMAGSIVLNFARQVKAKRVIYSSSSSVVGNGDGPTSPYGLQKLVTEMECKLYADLYGVDTVGLRYFNVYSEDQTVDGPYATAVANWMEYIREGETPFITGDGEQRRDMLYVHDAVAANIFCMEYDDEFNGAHYDVGTGTNISLNELKGIVREYHPDVSFEYRSPRPGDVLYTKADTGPLAELGWRVKVKLSEGLNRCFKGVENDKI
jgi:nucleoside-diphosphate-sugar epimerase